MSGRTAQQRSDSLSQVPRSTPGPGTTCSDPPLPAAHLTLALLKGTGKEVQTDIRGASMRPLLAEGDRVSLQLLAPEKLKTGDLLAFLEGPHLVVHRLIRKQRRRGSWWFCQKGDNSSNWSWITADKILGKAGAVRRASRTLDLARWPWTWVNPGVALATSSLLGVQQTLETSGPASPARGFLTILVRAGYKVLRLLMRGLCLAASHREPQPR